MSAVLTTVLTAGEPGARYLAAIGADLPAPLVVQFDLLATAPGGVARLRELILTLAVQGKLVPQHGGDEPAGVLLGRIREEKARLIANGELKRGKPLAAIDESELPFDLPAGWLWARLGTLLKKIGAGSTPLGGKEVYVPSGIKFLRSQNIWDDGLRLDRVAFIKPETHARMPGTIVVANDLLFNITGASIGRCAVVPSDFDEANVSQHVTIIRPVLASLDAFLHKVLVSRHVQQAVMDVQVGVSREGLSIAKLANFLIPLPPLAEQSRIVARVDELMRLCDALDAKGQLEAAQHAQLLGTLLGTLTDSTSPQALAEQWHRVAAHFDLLLDRPEAVDALEQTILQLAVRGLLVPQDPNDEPASSRQQRIAATKLAMASAGQVKIRTQLPAIADGEMPFSPRPGWAWVRIDDLAEVQGGIQKTPLRRPIHRHYPYLRVANVQRDALNLDEIERFELSDDELDKWQLRAGDLLIVEGNGSETEIGRCALWNGALDPCVYQNHLIRVRCLEAASIDFIRLFLNAPHGRDEMKRLAITTSGLFNLSVGKIRNYVVPLPPLAEQSRILARVTELRHLCTDLRQRLAARQATQAQLAQALVESAAG